MSAASTARPQLAKATAITIQDATAVSDIPRASAAAMAAGGSARAPPGCLSCSSLIQAALEWLKIPSPRMTRALTSRWRANFLSTPLAHRSRRNASGYARVRCLLFCHVQIPARDAGSTNVSACAARSDMMGFPRLMSAHERIR